MKIRQLFEKRKNPHLNPKVGFTAKMEKRLNDAVNLPNSAVPNAFVSFTALDKLGINPRSKYSTPIGIYAYPLSYVKDVVGEGHTNKLPFAGSQPYSNFFSLKDSATVIVSSDFTTNDLKPYVDKLREKFGDSAVTKATEEYNDGAPYEDSPFGTLWGITFWLSAKHKNSAVAWNKMLRDLGIDAFVDMGYGTIHGAEPTQMVVLNPSAITNVDRIKNTGHREVANLKQELENVMRSGNRKEIAAWLLKLGASANFDIHPKVSLIVSLLDIEPDLAKYFTISPEYELEVIRKYPAAIQYLFMDRELLSSAVEAGLFKNLLVSESAVNFAAGMFALGTLRLSNEESIALLKARATQYEKYKKNTYLESARDIIDVLATRWADQATVDKAMLTLFEVADLSYDEIYTIIDSKSIYEPKFANAAAYALMKKYRDSPQLRDMILTIANYSDDLGGHIGDALEHLANTTFPYDSLQPKKEVTKVMLDRVSPQQFINLACAISHRRSIPAQDLATLLKKKGIQLDAFKKQVENLVGDESPLYMELEKLG